MKNSPEQSQETKVSSLSIAKNILIYETKIDAAFAIGNLLLETLKKNPKLSIALPSGSAFKDIYSFIGSNWSSLGLSFSQTNIFLMSEFFKPENNHETLFCWLHKHLLASIDVINKNVFVPSHKSASDSTNLNEEDFNKKLVEHNPLDFEFLHLGDNGSIAYNEPSNDKDTINSLTGISNLSDSNIKEWTSYFRGKTVSKQVITMGILEIINAKNIIMPVYDIAKIDALVQLFTATKYDPNWPITALIYTQSDIKIYLDKPTYDLLRKALKK